MRAGARGAQGRPIRAVPIRSQPRGDLPQGDARAARVMLVICVHAALLRLGLNVYKLWPRGAPCNGFLVFR